MAPSAATRPARLTFAIGGRVLAAAGAAGLVGWWGLDRLENWFRREQADRIAVRALQSPSGAAEPSIDLLAELGSIGVQRIAWLATEPRHDLAQAARKELTSRMTAWLERYRDAGRSDALLAELGPAVEVLRARAATLPGDDCRWCESFILVALDATTALPPHEAAAVIADCDAVLASLPRRTLKPHPADPALAGRSSGYSLPTIDPTDVVLSRRETLAADEGLAPDAPTYAAPAPQWTTIGPAPPAAAEREPAAANESVAVNPLPYRAPTIAAGPAATAGSPRLTALPSPLEMRQRRRAASTMSTATLVEQLPHADSYAAGVIREELSARGVDLRSIEESLQSAPVTPGVEESPSLAKRISQLPAADARALLRVTAESGTAVERVEALALLATARDPQLAEIARRRALTDEDPRVAERAAAILEQVRR